MGNMLAFLGRDMAVDLGTANTLVYVRRRGIALNEPSVVALDTDTGKIVAVGVQAERMIGRTPGNIVAIRPLKDGVIADFDVTERMLRYFIQKVHRRRHLAGPRLVVAVPSGITGVEQSAVKEAGHQAGARRVYIIEEPMAAAIGAGLRHRPPLRSADAVITSHDPLTGQPVTVTFAAAKACWSPPGAVGFVGRADCDGPARGFSCGYPNFFANSASACQWASQHRQVASSVLDQARAQAFGAQTFGSLVSDGH